MVSVSGSSSASSTLFIAIPSLTMSSLSAKYNSEVFSEKDLRILSIRFTIRKSFFPLHPHYMVVPLEI